VRWAVLGGLALCLVVGLSGRRLSGIGQSGSICAKMGEVRNGIDELAMTNNDQTLDDLKRAIRTVGLRATPARLAILQMLRASPAPLTHAEVTQQVCSLGIDGATVFRNLNGMAQVGLLRRAELGDHVWRFEAIMDRDHDSSHPHFLCVDCGAVTCLSEVKLTSGSQRVTDSVGEVTEILVRGHCNACR
jgi:Fur family transcriptional regulator, ferric uptake regulator